MPISAHSSTRLCGVLRCGKPGATSSTAIPPVCCTALPSRISAIGTARLLQRIAAFHERDLIRGALLHDYFLYDWHIPDPTHRLHGFRHPGRALENAQRDFVLSDIERDIIRKHMFPLTPALPRYRESLLVSAVDKACSVYECFRHPAYPRLRARIYRVLEGTVR